MTKGGKCPTCGLVVKTNLRRHMKNHLSYEDRPHKCPYCDMQFIQLSNLRSHLRRKHEIQTADLPYDQQNSHLMNEHNKNSPAAEKSQEIKARQSNRLRKSSSASKQTKSSNDKKQRIASTSKTALKEFKCERCGKSFTEKDYLKKHMKNRKYDCLKKFKCDKCYKSYTSRSSLIDHSYAHQEEFRFSCENCGTNFKERALFASHKTRCKTSSLSLEKNSESDQEDKEENLESSEEILIEIKEEIMENDFEFKVPELPEKNDKNLPRSPKSPENSRKRKRRNLKIKARQVINCVMHYNLNEKNSDGSITERWLPVFEVDDFDDVIEFEKFMAKVEIGSEEDNFNPLTESLFLSD